MPELSRPEHLAAVEQDYDGRVPQWQSIYEGESFHDHAIRRRLERTLDLVDRLPASPGLAVDVGCGAGQLLVELARRGWTVRGTDISEGMVRESRRRLAEAGLTGEVDKAEAEELPVADGEVGLITALGLIEYLPDPDRGLREILRVLAPGGRAIVTAPNPARLAYLADPIGTLRRRRQPPAGGYSRKYWTPWHLRTALRRAGFEIVHLEGHGIGPLTFAGRRLMSDARAIGLGERLERMLPAALTRWLGANLIAVVTR